MSVSSIGSTAYNFFVRYLEYTSLRLGKSGFPIFVWNGYKKDVKNALKESGFKVSSRTMDFSKTRRGKWTATALFDAKFGDLRFHVHASLLDHIGRFRIRPIAFGVTMVYVERTKPGILSKLVSTLKRNFSATDTLAIRLIAAKADIVKECSQRYRNACYLCEALIVDYTKYEEGIRGYTYTYVAGMEMVVKGSVTISLENIKELLNTFLEQ